ncbi:hypothetical protein ACQ4M3_39710 [Leptolyngbya sp. AN03gr2]
MTLEQAQKIAGNPTSYSAKERAQALAVLTAEKARQTDTLISRSEN